MCPANGEITLHVISILWGAALLLRVILTIRGIRGMVVESTNFPRGQVFKSWVAVLQSPRNKTQTTHSVWSISFLVLSRLFPSWFASFAQRRCTQTLQCRHDTTLCASHGIRTEAEKEEQPQMSLPKVPALLVPTSLDATSSGSLLLLHN